MCVVKIPNCSKDKIRHDAASPWLLSLLAHLAPQTSHIQNRNPKCQSSLLPFPPLPIPTGLPASVNSPGLPSAFLKPRAGSRSQFLPFLQHHIRLPQQTLNLPKAILHCCALVQGTVISCLDHCSSFYACSPTFFPHTSDWFCSNQIRSFLCLKSSTDLSHLQTESTPKILAYKAPLWPPASSGETLPAICPLTPLPASLSNVFHFVSSLGAFPFAWNSLSSDLHVTGPFPSMSYPQSG
jgi:hypothetical protein